MNGVIYIGADAQHMLEAPVPESVSVALSDIGADVRTMSGRLVRQRSRSGIREITVTWKELSSCEKLMEIMNGDSFFMTYPDPVEGGFRTAEYYCTYRNVKIAYSVGGVPHTETLAVRCVEV